MAVSKRNIYEALIQAVAIGAISAVALGEGDKAVSVQPEDIKAYAENELALLDKRNVARAAKNAEKNAGKYAPIIEGIVEKYAGQKVIASALATEYGVSVGVMASILSRNPDKFVSIGKVKGEKKSKVNGYQVVGGEGEDVEA